MDNILNSLLKEENTLLELIESYKEGYSPLYIHGLLSDGLIQLGDFLRGELNEPILVILSDERKARDMALEWQNLREDIYYYPSRDLNFYDIEAIDNQDKKERLKILSLLAENKNIVVITTWAALLEKISPREKFLEKSIYIDLNSIIEIDEIRNKLHKLNYRAVPRIASAGEFSVRGGIIDVYPINEDRPVRIELFDIEVDSIRSFDIGTQLSVENIDWVKIWPAESVVFEKGIKEDILKALDKEYSFLEKHIEEDYYEKAYFKLSRLKEGISNNELSENLNLIIPYIKEENLSSLLDYFDGMVLIEDIGRIFEEEKEKTKLREETIELEIERGEAFSSHRELFFKEEKTIKNLERKRIVNTSSLMKKMKIFSPVKIFNIKSLEAENFRGNYDEFFKEIKNLLNQKMNIVLSLGNIERKTSIEKILFEKNIPLSKDKTGLFTTEANYSQGIHYPSANLYLFTHKEIYGRKKLKSKRPKSSAKDRIRRADLSIGDLVVHENYGIGRFDGFETISLKDITNDYLIISYRGTDKLYLPTDQLQWLRKYIGDDGKEPRLNRLHSPEWHRTRANAKKAVYEIAEDLVELYGKREKEVGHAFSKDTSWQNEFEENFIYEETLSQLNSIKEIKGDMEALKPMDRILCGDVGYGKTEVALRAGFKAIMDGKQVAFLCPTTILAEQHYETAKARFGEFPIRTEVLSRFKTPGQSKNIIRKTKLGEVDFIVGTHRLLSKDIGFKDLGLLIVDEEQRFGVRHKERLKILSEGVDVLTLSATPIPRTLQMGLVGIRDMSLLDEPPAERFPATTYVMEYNSSIIKSAIERELLRGGQVYYVHNRVMDINKVALELEELVPDGNIGVAHGQMSEKALSEIMRNFIAGDIDILLSTTIIETGLDISNVNTMIVSNADRMGLSQMYQLKGRVGRGNRSSYAYFTYPENKVLSEKAEKRLLAIRDFSEFGSGYKIAMRDLELRGAGNLLGESQSGHIEAIGYDLYIKYLEEALERAKGKEKDIKIEEIEMEISHNAFIPDEYISDIDLKMEMYQRLATLSSNEEILEITDELIDRFGDLPDSVYNIILAMKLKNLARELSFEKIEERGNEIIFRFSRENLFQLEEIAKISGDYPGQAIFQNKGKGSLIYIWKKKKIEESIAFLESILERKKE